MASKYGYFDDEEEADDELMSDSDEPSLEELNLAKGQVQMQSLIQRAKLPLRELQTTSTGSGVKSPPKYAEEEVEAAEDSGADGGGGGKRASAPQKTPKVEVLYEEEQEEEMLFFDGSSMQMSAFKTKKFKFDPSAAERRSFMTPGRLNDTGASLKMRDSSDYKTTTLPSKLFSIRVEEPPARPLLVERAPVYSFNGLTQIMGKDFPRRNLPITATATTTRGVSNGMPKSVETEQTRGSARVGFGPNSQVIMQPDYSYSTNVEIYKMEPVPTLETYFIRYLEERGRLDELEAFKKSQALHWTPPSKLLLLIDSFLLKISQGSHSANMTDHRMLKMCDALFLPPSRNREALQCRRFAEWIREDLKLYPPASAAGSSTRGQPLSLTGFRLVFSHLVSGATQQAMEEAKRAGLYNISLLISMYLKLPPGALIQEQIYKQLMACRKNKKAEVEVYFEKILQLLSGAWKPGELELPPPPSSTRTSLGAHYEKRRESCLAGLNRLQILGIIIWYWSKPSTTLQDCVELLGEIEAQGFLSDSDLSRFPQ